tara:strand:- start:107 stop:274 length:168 start_codon:yes stop_codon:yes gene_type:complete
MDIQQLPIKLLAHLEYIGLLPRHIDEDGIDNIENPDIGRSFFRKPDFDEHGEPEF